MLTFEQMFEDGLCPLPEDTPASSCRRSWVLFQAKCWCWGWTVGGQQGSWAGGQGRGGNGT